MNARGVPSKARGWSAERRILVGHRLAAERALRKRARHPALHLRRFLSPEPYFRVGADAFAPLIRPAFASLQPHRVQPFKAAPLSGGGRGPEAPGCGVRTRPRAPRSARDPLSDLKPPGSLSRISGQGPVPGCSTSGSPHEASPREQAGQPRRMILRVSRTIFKRHWACSPH